jgi:phosphotransferase system enzyme I (PtsI)
MSNLPDIVPLAAKILRADDPDKLRALVAKLND